ncbi:phosphoesterase PA-phosphatase related protein [Thermodesulfatator indicus DSM 15286]|uniref:Phosphoesterase PA-phosphatase related protein n=1 Tax=Thermodesulfatator indicus (strain DSM 15286 / JCM 11887 / CIR29812) TaxID=667014 RepID=F8A853_THEID|nr:phosphatase PAP2 family protein [Thermodesulfatator indicus]AEH45052.1 phosphoesterase PA-phosphatase related protein [Thermodesulfatator indicus DSM 15286]
MINIESFYPNLSIFYLVQSLHTPELDLFFKSFVILGKGWILLPVLVLVFFKFRKHIGTFLLAILLETLIVILIKNVFPQPRPGSLLDNFKPLLPLYHCSFPSGDVALVFVIIAFFYRKVNKLGQVVLLAYSFLVGIERIYLGVHFPLDVLAGAIIGISSFFIARKIQLKPIAFLPLKLKPF